MHNCYSWQQTQWQYILTRKRSGNLPHALLFTGAAGLGKFDFANLVAAELLCTANQALPCGKCNGCALLAAKTHPDFFTLQPEEAGKQIKIDQIRDLVAELNNTAQQGGYQVVIIEPADALNIAAANALLKTLEEPSAKVVIMLVTAKLELLLPTIRSRCQIITFKQPTKSQAKEWLQTQVKDAANIDLALTLTDFAPLQALELLQQNGLVVRQAFMQNLIALTQGKLNAIKFAADCNDYSLPQIINYLVALVGDLIKIKCTQASAIYNLDMLTALTPIAAKVSVMQLYDYHALLMLNMQHWQRKINLNQQMVLENLLLEWEKMVKHAR